MNDLLYEQLDVYGLEVEYISMEVRGALGFRWTFLSSEDIQEIKKVDFSGLKKFDKKETMESMLALICDRGGLIRRSELDTSIINYKSVQTANQTTQHLRKKKGLYKKFNLIWIKSDAQKFLPDDILVMVKLTG